MGDRPRLQLGAFVHENQHPLEFVAFNATL